MSEQTPGKGVGRVFMIVAWCAGLYLAAQFFGRWEQRQQNPNTEVTSQQGEGYIEVKLLGNAQGHFVASGRINNVPVEFYSIPAPPMWRCRWIWPGNWHCPKACR